MVKFLDLPQERTTGQRLMEGLGLASQSIPDLIGGYQKTKQMGQAADYIGLKGDQREAFLSLPEEIQSKVLPGLISEANNRKAFGEKVPLGAAKYLKEFHPSLYDLPQAKQKIGELAQKYYGEGLSETDAYRKAIEDYQGKGKGRGVQELGQSEESEGRNLYERFLKGAPDSERSQVFGIPKAGEGESIFHKGVKERGTIDPVTGKAIKGQPSIAGSLTEPSILSGKQIFGSEVLGAIAPAYEFLLKERGNVDPTTGRKIIPTPLITERLREKLQEGATPEQKTQMEAAEFLGGFIPIERALFGLAKIGKQAGFMKNVEKIAASKGITVEQAAESIVKEAKSSGIDLARAAEGNAQEAGKLYNLSNKIAREAPNTATLKRVERAAPEKKFFPTKERMAIRESQLKEFPKYEAEIAQDAAERAESRIPKTEVGKESQRLRIHEAMRNLPKAEEGFRKAIARVRALENEAANLSGVAKERANALIELSKNELKDAEFALKQSRENLTGQSIRVGLAEMRQAAQKKMLDIAEKIEKGEEVVLSKADYNPEMIQKAKEIEKRKSLPAVKQDDFYTQVHKEYGDQYRKQLQRIEQEIKELPKSMVSAEQYNALKKERDILKKLANQTDAEQKIHRHKLGLREAEERHKAAQRLKRLKQAEGSPKVEKVAKAKIEEAVRNPIGKEAEGVAAKVGVKKEDLGSFVKQTGVLWEKVGKNAAKSGPKLFKDLNDFLKTGQQQGWWTALTKTPAGQEILTTGFQLLAEEFLGRKVPYLATILGGVRGQRYGAAAVRAVIIATYRAVKDEIIKQQYLNAIKEGNDQRTLEIKKKHPKLVKEARGRLVA